MLSKRLLFWLHVLTPRFASLGVTKYSWNSEQQLFYKVIGNQWAVRLSGIFLADYFTFLFLQTIRFYFQQDINSVLVLITQQGAAALATLSYLLTIISGDLFFEIINDFLVFLKQIESKSRLFICIDLTVSVC